LVVPITTSARESVWIRAINESSGLDTTIGTSGTGLVSANVPVGAFVPARIACVPAKNNTAITRKMDSGASLRFFRRTKNVSRKQLMDFCKSLGWKELKPRPAA
jgi:hypothetical protein